MNVKRDFVPEEKRNFSPEEVLLMRKASDHIRYLISVPGQRFIMTEQGLDHIM